jgi:Zn-dependent protease with chaperone function
MKLSKISEKYKNKSFSLYFKSLLILSILPLLFYISVGHFSGFGYIIVNANTIQFFQKIIIFNFFLGLLIPSIILLSSIIAGLYRNRIATLFPVIVNFTIYGLILYLIIVILSYGLSVFLFLNEITGLYFLLILLGIVLTISLFYVFPPIVKGIFNFSTVRYIPIIGVVLNDKDHKEIFLLIEKLSKEINTIKPKNIVVSLSTDFYAISKDVTVFNGVNEFNLKGETLHISLPFLRVLTIKELEGVIAHELGHFQGDDTLYAIKFAPIYRRLNQQFLELDDFFEENKDAKTYFLRLAAYPITFLFNEFSRKEEKISKEQELKADNYGANASSGTKTFINALSKIYIYGLVWSETTQHFREMINSNETKKIKNLSKNFYNNAISLFDKNKLKDYLIGLQMFEQEHPSDTHPNLETRMKNLNVNIESLSNEELNNFEPTASSLISNIDVIEENLTLVLSELEK